MEERQEKGMQTVPDCFVVTGQGSKTHLRQRGIVRLYSCLEIDKICPGVLGLSVIQPSRQVIHKLPV